jgi:ATP-dependent DNA helicase RecG
VLRWIQRDFMSNTTLRARFSLKEGEYQKVSDVISNGIKSRRIIPADPSQGKRNAKYIPYWAG